MYASICQACHQADGKGIEKAFPPLVKSDYFASNPEKIIHVITHGLTGPVTVNGKEFNSVMPKQALSDNQVAAVATYVLNNFGNKGGELHTDDVVKIRQKK